MKISDEELIELQEIILEAVRKSWNIDTSAWEAKEEIMKYIREKIER